MPKFIVRRISAPGNDLGIAEIEARSMDMAQVIAQALDNKDFEWMKGVSAIYHEVIEIAEN
jgi:hypothetical protein